MKSVPNWIFYLHDFLWIFSQLLAIWFELFSFVSVFNSENRCRGVPPVSLSLCAGPARQQAVYAWRHTSAPCVKGVVPTAPRLPCPSHAAPDSPVARLASHAVDNRVRSRRRFASDRVCPSAPRHRRRHHLCLGKCAAPPCLHAEPAALTSLPPPRAPAAGCLTSPPSSCVGRRRAVRARAPLTPTVYPSLVRPPGRCPCAARICAVMPQSLRRSTPPLSLPLSLAQARAAARARWSSVPPVPWAAFQRRPSRPLWFSAGRSSERATPVLCASGPLEIRPSGI
jgi:hypothetical protein